MQKKKIIIILPDGVGLKNFVFTNFLEIGQKKGYDITFWNLTAFDLSQCGYKEIKIKNAKTHPITNFLKIAQTKIELSLNCKKSNDKVYNYYLFPYSFKGLKSSFKSVFVKGIVFFNNSENGLRRIRKSIANNERKTKSYFDSLEILEREKPDMVFCTNQRMMLSVSSILAAKELGIPTASFIFSWDNLPKGTKIIETDFYFVWSNHMKDELQYYYPYISEHQIFITGTPQFETHFDESILVSKETFFKENNLDLEKKYICFSGDDITTSPNDQIYLSDLASSIKELNNSGYNLGIIFRRCPVDFSNRFDTVLNEYNNEIKIIDPKWKKMADSWDAVMPTREDLVLQMNTIFHSECVINLGSSMVFDFAAFNKPCGFVNYDVSSVYPKDWSVKKIYNFIHFRSMPIKDSVFWINNPKDLKKIVEKMLSNDLINVVENAQKWFKIINQHPPEKASERIWYAIEKIIEK